MIDSLNGPDGLDRQTAFERKVMDEIEDDWFISEEELDAIRLVSYRLYELDCEDVLEDA